MLHELDALCNGGKDVSPGPPMHFCEAWSCRITALFNGLQLVHRRAVFQGQWRNRWMEVHSNTTTNPCLCKTRYLWQVSNRQQYSIAPGMTP
jgi:hypothetical protein